MWDEQRQILTIGERQGNYPNCLKKRIFNVVFVNESNGFDITYSTLKKHVNYSGKNIVLKIK